MQDRSQRSEVRGKRCDAIESFNDGAGPGEGNLVSGMSQDGQV